jgi:hypothetical protein
VSESTGPCPYRYLHLGRSFCALAIVESRYTVREVFPDTCRECEVPGISAAHPCGRMDLGVEISVYAGRPSVGMHYESCDALRERIFDLSGCTKEGCPFWLPLDEERQTAVREAAREKHHQSS